MVKRELPIAHLKLEAIPLWVVGLSVRAGEDYGHMWQYTIDQPDEEMLQICRMRNERDLGLCETH